MSWFYSKSGPNAETVLWDTLVTSAGGTLAGDSYAIADALVSALKAQSYYSKIKYLLPLLGSNLAAARIPLIDTLAVGQAGSAGFVNGDFSQSTGLQGNGSTTYLSSLIKPSQLGTSNNGGIGYIENNINFGGSASSLPMGCHNGAATDYFGIQAHSTVVAGFYWGLASNKPGDLSGSATNGHFYGQRSSATSREIFKDGVSKATNTTSDATSGANEHYIVIGGFNIVSSAISWAGRCAGAYMTDGTLSGADITSLTSILATYLTAATGRP